MMDLQLWQVLQEQLNLVQQQLTASESRHEERGRQEHEWRRERDRQSQERERQSQERTREAKEANNKLARELEEEKAKNKEWRQEREHQSQERTREAKEANDKLARQLEEEKAKNEERGRQSQERTREAKEANDKLARELEEEKAQNKEWRRERERQSQERTREAKEANDKLARQLEEENAKNKEWRREREHQSQERTREAKEANDKLARQLEEEKAKGEERGRQEQEWRRERERQSQERTRLAKETHDQLARELEERGRQLHQMQETHRLSTFPEYTVLCHDAYFKMKVEPNPKLLATGAFTNPIYKLCPTSLRKWGDFLDIQKTTIGQFIANFPMEKEFFDSRGFTQRLGESVLSKPIADEKGLEKFLSLAIERPVTAILDEARKLAAMKRDFGLRHGLKFENHLHALGDASEEVSERVAARNASEEVSERASASDASEEGSERASAQHPVTPPHQTGDNSQIRPDQICIYINKSGKRKMAFVCEYKAPHKLTEHDLRVGLHEMNVHKDVATRKTKIPPVEESDARFLFNAERLTASAVTQTYHYMIHSGLEYGLIATGRVIIFLKIDWQTPSTLFYHMAEPSDEVKDHKDNFQTCSVISQYVAFCLLAISKGRIHPQNVREDVIDVSKRWSEDFESTLRSIDPKDRRAPPGSSAYVPRTYSAVDRTPPVTRARPLMVANPFCRIPSTNSPSTNYSDDDEAGPGAFPDTPCPPERGSNGSQGNRRSARIQAQGSKSHHNKKPADNEYCTQKCLLGLVSGNVLDPRCPNVAAHRANSTGSHHPVTHEVWLKSLSEQLRRDLDDGVVKLEMEGAYGVLFKIIHLELGYTFVAKGTIAAYIREIKHEAAIYDQLWPVQGLSVPVYLGSLDLRDVKRTYYYDHRVYIIYLMFLSWGGERFESVPAPEEKAKVNGQIERSVRSLHKHGVLHKDLRPPNILFNAETQRIMIIDFGTAFIFQESRPASRPALASRSANRQSLGPETDKKTKASPEKRRYRNAIAWEIYFAQEMF
ncbi:hypothetical protein CDD81_4033 [Ophiocordyceps australis]|uniref:Protein kinase domain-containing protein n=1 Tax=Ophiocordyceps australis TaxID=1399860 RepID=A0A2C5YD27_9HYPO|nr:hypothetical protein CDD81_4033 [Ophiocordyceps australis]